MIKLKCRLLTLNEAKERIDSYIKKQQDSEQVEGLLKYRRELDSNFDSKEEFVTLYQSSDS